MSRGAARVAVCAAEPGAQIERRAALLAEQIGLPLAAAGNPEFDILLAVTSERLELRFPQRGGPGPIYVDFVGGPLGYARRVNRFGSLFDAVGFRKGRPSVLDATAGLGADAFRLAFHGCQVTAVERSPILFALLEDGLRRADAEPELAEKLGGRLRLVQGDSREVLARIAASDACPATQGAGVRASVPAAENSETVAAGDPANDAPDVVYLDPMFAPRTKSALVKVEMRVVGQLVGGDPDAGELFELARGAAQLRVVVKRHAHAEALAPHPSHSHTDTTTRYDVYLTPPRPPSQ